MNVNIFNDCENEYLFVDSAYMYKTCFLDKSSDLLKNILASYNTSEKRIEAAWKLVLEGKVPSDKVSFAYILILNDLILEAHNYLRLQQAKLRKQILLEDVNASEDAIKAKFDAANQTFIESLDTPRLTQSQIKILSLLLEPYVESLSKSRQNFGFTYRRIIDPILRKSGSASELTHSPLMDCEANNFMNERFFSDAYYGVYRLNLLRDAKGQVVLGGISLIEGETPPSVMSVNTLAFPTTVAPIIAFNSPNEQPKAMVGLAQNLNQIDQVTEQLQNEHRISATGDMTLDAKRELLRDAKSIVDKAQANGETSALVSTVSARLNAEVDALSKDPSSPYFGMASKDIKAGLISKFLGGSKGYNDLAMRFDSALTKGIKYIKDETSHAVFAIAEFENKALSESVRNAMVTEANANIQDATKRINELVSTGKPFFTIDEKALRERGFNPSFEPIPRPNAAFIPLIVTGVKIVGAIALVSILVMAIEVFIDHFELEEERESKRNLQILLQRVVDIRARLKSILDLVDANFEVAKTELTDYAKTIPSSKNNLQLIDNNDTSNSLVQQEMANVNGLYKKILTVANDTSLTQASLKRQLELILSNADLVKNSTLRSISVENKIIEDLEKRDPIDALLEGITRGIEKAGDFLRYAGYISLGLFSIWGGVKLYRSLNSEED